MGTMGVAAGIEDLSKCRIDPDIEQPTGFPQRPRHPQGIDRQDSSGIWGPPPNLAATDGHWE